MVRLSVQVLLLGVVTMVLASSLSAGLITRVDDTDRNDRLNRHSMDLVLDLIRLQSLVGEYNGVPTPRLDRQLDILAVRVDGSISALEAVGLDARMAQSLVDLDVDWRLAAAAVDLLQNLSAVDPEASAAVQAGAAALLALGQVMASADGFVQGLAAATSSDLSELTTRATQLGILALVVPLVVLAVIQVQAVLPLMRVRRALEHDTSAEQIAALRATGASEVRQAVDALRGALTAVDDERRHLAARVESATAVLNARNAQLQEIVYVASHDLQEPLRTISGYLQLIERRHADEVSDEAARWIREAVAGARRQQTLIEDLLAYSRVSTRGGEFVECDLDSLVADVLRDLSAQVSERQAEVQIVDTLGTVVADRRQITQAVQNLVSNAIKFTPAGEQPQVRISTARTAHEVALHVSDQGIGIEPRFHGRIFGVFQRLHGRDEFSGTGIGLALVRAVVERHGGRIDVSSSLGAGSTFTLVLPTQPTDTAHERDPARSWGPAPVERTEVQKEAT